MLSDFAHNAKCDCGACDRAKYPHGLDPFWLLFVKAAGWCLLAAVALPFLFVVSLWSWWERKNKRTERVKDARGYWNHG